MSPTFPSLSRFLPASLLALAGCGGHVDAPPPPPPPPDSPDAILESEPNDTAYDANYIGELYVGDYVVIEGDITECCVDPYDGFAFFAAEPMQITVTLTELASADLDFCVYDPSIDEIVACWETDLHPEWGFFNVGYASDLQLVVASYAGASGYTLEISASPITAAPDLPGAPGRGEPPSESTLRRLAGYHHPRPGPSTARYFLLLKDGETEVFLPLQGDEAPAGR